MNRTLTAAVSLPLLATLLLSGCEDEAGQVRVQTQQQLDAANETLREAQVLFAPRPAQNYDPDLISDLDKRPDAYALRREQMQAVAKDLDQVIAKGDESQKAAAHRLKAAILASLAESHRRDAAKATLAVTDQTATLVDRVVTASRRARVAESLKGEGALSQPKLTQELEAAKGDLAAVQSQRQPLVQQQQQLTTERERFTAEAEQARAEADRLDEQAFTAADAQATFDLQTKAAEARRRGEEATRDRELREVALGQVERDLRPLEKRLTAQERRVAGLEALVEQARDANLTRERVRLEGEQVLKTQLDEVQTELSETMEAYEQQVAGGYRDAAARLEASIAELEAAQRAGAASAVDADLLDRRVDLAGVYAGHAAAARRVAGALSTMQDTMTRVPDADLGLADRLAALEAERDQLQQQVTQVAQEAESVADTLKGRGGQGREAETIEQQRMLVKAYVATAAGTARPAGEPEPEPEAAPPAEDAPAPAAPIQEQPAA